MARVVFFSFDYDDVWRVNQVRNSGAFVGEKRSGFRDKAEYEQVKRGGDAAIQRWIRKQMRGCSVTCVLIGRNTNASKWVHFEIDESIKHGMGLVGVFIHKLKNRDGRAAAGLFLPDDPLSKHELSAQTNWQQLFPDSASDRYPSYVWEPGRSARNQLGQWIEKAARLAGRE